MYLGPVIVGETPKITLRNNRFRSDLTKLFLTSEINPFPTLVSPVVERSTYKAGKTSAEVTYGLSLDPPSALPVFKVLSCILHCLRPYESCRTNDSGPHFAHTNHPFCGISPCTVRIHPEFTCLLLNH